MDTVHLKIERVSKRFGDVQALREVSLEVPKGSFTTFLGPSGCGKTTLLRSIAGFYRVDEGTIRLGERVLNDVPSHQRDAIMVFQDYALFPHMNIRQNIAYGLKVRRMAEAEIGRRIARTVEYLGLEGLEERSPGQISGGQQQRVALARALVMEPEVLLLDEPLSNLDAKLRMSIRAELRQLQKRLGITTVYVTHDQAEALALSDQIAVMDRGRIGQVGSPWEIYYRPASAAVANFVGTANLIDGTVTASRPERVEVDIGGAVIGVEEPGGALQPGEAVTLCVRPETIEVLGAGPAAAGPAPPPDNQLPARVRTHIFEGSHIRYWMEAGRRTLLVDVADPSERGVREGEVRLRLHPRKIHLLTGERAAAGEPA